MYLHRFGVIANSNFQRFHAIAEVQTGETEVEDMTQYGSQKSAQGASRASKVYASAVAARVYRQHIIMARPGFWIVMPPACY